MVLPESSLKYVQAGLISQLPISSRTYWRVATVRSTDLEPVSPVCHWEGGREEDPEELKTLSDSVNAQGARRPTGLRNQELFSQRLLPAGTQALKCSLLFLPSPEVHLFLFKWVNSL